MTLAELKRLAATSMAQSAQMQLDPEKACVFLQFPTKWKAPKGFPRRRFAGHTNGEVRACYVNAEKLLAWAQKTESETN